jgi:hypothetical protein
MSARRVPTAVLVTLAVLGVAASALAQPNPAAPWVYEKPAPPKIDAGTARSTGLGTLNMMTADSRNAVLARIDGDKVYDLSVQYFIGLPSWYGAEDLPPIVARGVLIDVAGLKKVPVLPDAYRITTEELQEALAAEHVSLQKGDIVLIRGGKITLDAAHWLAETSGAMIIGGDYLSLETYKYGRPDLTVPVHHYLLREREIAIIQVDNLDDLARDHLYEFAFIAASIRGGQGIEFRPLAFPLHPKGS